MNRVNSETGCYYYDSAVTAEVVRAKTAERGLSVLIDNEKERASQAENEIRESVAAESRRAESKEAEILETFNTTVSEVTGSLEAIKQIESTLVHRSGDETISDVKTFSSSPKVPTPGSSSNDTSAATTAFVRNAVGTAITNAKVGIHDWTCLFDGDVWEGNITLKQSFMNFDRMVVFSGDDGGNHVASTDHSTFIFNKMMNGVVGVSGHTGSVVLAFDWRIFNFSNGSSETFFKTAEEGSRIYSIYGYNVQKK